MPFVEALKLALAAILGHKLRSFLTLLGVIFGVATVIVVVSLVEGFNHYVDEKIANIGTNAFAVRKFSIDDFSSVAALNAARRRNKDIRLEDAEALRARAGSIGDVGAKAQTIGEVKYESTTLSRMFINATTANVADIERIEAGSGRYFNKGEDDTRRRVCFIGADVAEKPFPRSEPLGQTIRMDGHAFQVIGVRKAIGARRNDIVRQFLLEAIVLSELGGLIGILLGVAGGNGIAIWLDIAMVFPWGWAFTGLIVCSLIGTGFGWYPAFKASRLDPIEALRYE